MGPLQSQRERPCFARFGHAGATLGPLRHERKHGRLAPRERQGGGGGGVVRQRTQLSGRQHRRRCRGAGPRLHFDRVRPQGASRHHAVEETQPVPPHADIPRLLPAQELERAEPRPGTVGGQGEDPRGEGEAEAGGGGQVGPTAGELQTPGEKAQMGQHVDHRH